MSSNGARRRHEPLDDDARSDYLDSSSRPLVSRQHVDGARRRGEDRHSDASLSSRVPRSIPTPGQLHRRSRHEDYNTDGLDSENLSGRSEEDQRARQRHETSRYQPDLLRQYSPLDAQNIRSEWAGTQPISRHDSRYQSGQNYDLSSRGGNHGSVFRRGRIEEEAAEDQDGSSSPHEQRSRMDYSRSPPSESKASYRTKHLPGAPSRRDSMDQRDRHRSDDNSRHQAYDLPQSPPAARRTRGNPDRMIDNMAGLAVTPTAEGTPRDAPSAPGTRRPSSNSLQELADAHFDFQALIVTEGASTRGGGDRRRTVVRATVDTGCDVDVVHQRALDRAGISGRFVEDLDRPINLEGFEGFGYKLTRRVKLTWGKAKHDGRKTRRDYFLVVDQLPDKLEMVLGRGYMAAEIQKKAMKPSRSRRQSEQDEDFDDWVVLGRMD